MNKLRLLIVSVFFLVPMLVFSQRTVKGVVTDKASGDTLPGVNIRIVGTNQGTTTDFDGNYQLEKITDGSVLEFSFIGFKTQTRSVDANTINIALEESSESLEEVIVVGYGTAKKEDLTGSVNQISAKDFNKGTVSSAQDLITGRIAGVTVIAPSGAPGEGGAINIRGLSSLSLDNQPLYVIDGFPIDNGGVGGSRNILDIINPNDIANMVVLKDASATAIYGSRAANGVVMISTKKGKDKDFSFSFGNKSSFYKPFETVGMMTAKEFRGVLEATEDAASIARLGTSETDWQREIFKPAIGTENNLSATGNAFGIPLRASVGYSNQDGILTTDNFKRLTGAISLKPSLLNNHLKVELNARAMNVKNFFANRGAIGSAIIFDPTQAIYDDSSPYGGYYTWLDPATGNPNSLAPANPLALLNQFEDTSNVNRFIGNVKFDYNFHFLPDLTATLNVGIDKSKGEGDKIASKDFASSKNNWIGTHDTYLNKRDNKLLDTYLTYSKEFDNHNVKLMGGYSYQSFYTDNFSYDDEKFQQGSDYEEIDLSKEVLLSYFTRLNYKFNNKYLFTASVRADASSKLNPDDRWGIFPSAALAWNIHKEKFMENSGVNELKLRVGYGEVGNVKGLAPYKYLTNYTGSTSTASYQFGYGTDGVPSFFQTYRPNPKNKDIRWEVGATTNIGLDYSLLDRRLSGSINLYKKETKDLIIWALVDPFTNVGNRVETNIGTMVNKGIEFEINSIVAQTENVNWNINYNVSFNDNEVTSMPFEQSVGGIEGGVGNNVQSHLEGQSPYSFYVYQQVYNSEGKPIEGVYVDRNKDGKINNEDKYYYKDPMADIQMGLSTTLKIDNFDLSITSRANIGNYIYDNIASSKGVPSNLTVYPFLSNLHADYFNTGFESDTETNLLSDHYVTDASFLKIDNITMGLKFPKLLKNSKIRVFISLQNVMTFTKYKGLDPEINGGIDNNFYPRPRTYTFGFNLDF